MHIPPTSWRSPPRMRRSQTYSIVRDVRASPFAGCSSSLPTSQPGPLASYSLRVDARSALDLWLLLHAGASSGHRGMFASLRCHGRGCSTCRRPPVRRPPSHDATGSWLEEQRLVRTERDPPRPQGHAADGGRFRAASSIAPRARTGASSPPRRVLHRSDPPATSSCRARRRC